MSFRQWIRGINSHGFYHLFRWDFWRSLFVNFYLFNILGHWAEIPYCTFMDRFFGIVDENYELWTDPWFKPYWVYGSGVVVMTLVIEPLKEYMMKRHKSLWAPALETFAIATALAAVMETAFGFICNQPDENGVYPFWDNSQLPGNILGQGWIVNDLVMGVMCVVYVWLAYPLISIGLEKLGEKRANILFVVASAAFALATVLSYVPNPLNNLPTNEEAGLEAGEGAGVAEGLATDDLEDAGGAGGSADANAAGANALASGGHDPALVDGSDAVKEVPAGSTVAFLGDSITEGGDFEAAFPSYDVRNFGVIGDTSAGVRQRVDEVVAADPAIVFLMVGTNDLDDDAAPASTIVEHVVANVRDIVTKLEEALPDATVVIESVLPTSDAGKNTAILTLDRDLAELAAELGGHTAYLGLYERYVGSDGLLDENDTEDGLHLTSEAYDPWYSLIRDLWLTA